MYPTTIRNVRGGLHFACTIGWERSAYLRELLEKSCIVEESEIFLGAKNRGVHCWSSDVLNTILLNETVSADRLNEISWVDAGIVDAIMRNVIRAILKTQPPKKEKACIKILNSEFAINASHPIDIGV